MAMNTPGGPHYIDFALPTPWEALRFFFSQQGYDVRVSTPGKYNNALLDLVSGLTGAEVFASELAYKILESLAPVKNDLLVLSGLAADKARPYGDGGGDHARAMAAFLTGVHPRKTDGNDIRAGTSVDQLAALRVANETRLPSLEIGCEAGGMAGNCDSGYSCVYSSTVSWKPRSTWTTRCAALRRCSRCRSPPGATACASSSMASSEW